MLKIGDLFVIHQLHREGWSIAAIARHMGLDRKTVRKYLNAGLQAPVYGPRAPRPRRLDPYRDYLKARVQAHPELSAMRLLREIRAMGYEGGRTAVTDYLQQVRPAVERGYEHRFETPPGQQGQADFAHFKVTFAREPQQVRVVWLFTLVLGFSRYLFGRFVARQTLSELVRCHLRALAELGGAPREVLYDRMKAVVLGEDADGGIIYHPVMRDLGAHYGFVPRACAPYRAKTKGKVERPFRYVREDFFLAGNFLDLDDLNAQFDTWRDTVANQRTHGTTRRIVREAFEEERAALQSLPALPYGAVLKLERRISRDGMVSVDGNEYSVPDTTRRRSVEVHSLADEIRIYDGHKLVAIHPVLDGRGQRRIAAGHRRFPPPGNSTRVRESAGATAVTLPGECVARRSLEVYHRIGQSLATRDGGAP